MQTISSLSRFVRDLTPFLDQVVGNEFQKWPPIASQFLEQKTMDSGWVDIGTRSTLGTFVEKGETDEQAEDAYIIGPQLRSAAIEYAKRVPTTKIALEDSRSFKHAAALLAGVGKDLADAAMVTKEIIGHDMINNITSYKTPDNTNVFALSKNLLNGGTYPNLYNLSFSESTLEQVVTHLKSMTNDRGHPIYQIPGTILAPVDLEWDVDKVLKTDRTLGSNNNDINVMARQNIRHISSPYVSSPTKWVLLAQKSHLNWYDREKGQSWVQGDDNRRIVEQGMTFRCAVAPADGRSAIMGDE